MTIPSSSEHPEYLNTTFTDPSGNLPAIYDMLPSVIGGWTRRPDYEAKTRDAGVNHRCYTRIDGKRPLLVINLNRDGQTGKIVDIQPDKGEEPITLEESNQLEQDFVSALRPLLPTTITVTQDTVRAHLKDLLTENTYNLFRNHSANKNTGNTHPNDRGRWLRFVQAAAAEGMDGREEHRELVHAALLQEGFPLRHADQISEDYVRHMEMAHAMM